MAQPLPPPLPQPPPDERLVSAISSETGIEAGPVRSWLSGEHAALHGDALQRARAALWRPLGGVNARAVDRKYASLVAPFSAPAGQSFKARVLAKAANSGEPRKGAA